MLSNLLVAAVCVVCVFFANQIFHLPCAYNRRRIASDDDDADADTVADNDGCGRTLIEAPSACIVVAQFRFISGVRAGERALVRPLPTTRIAIVPMRQPSSSVPAPTTDARRCWPVQVSLLCSGVSLLLLRTSDGNPFHQYRLNENCVHSLDQFASDPRYTPAVH